jgi:2-amino-4-hydroxy-6-hydroxymethyldihydropteridine pyrophosphokinase
MQAVLLLGGNLGEREVLLAQAREAIEQDCGPVLRASRLYETPAWGFTRPVPDFLNQALMIDTSLSPEALLRVCLNIELRLGRRRTEQQIGLYASRPIDIDILLYEDYICQSPDLTIPHPRLPRRRFALMPLAEIAPEWVHPQLGLMPREMLALCTD